MAKLTTMRNIGDKMEKRLKAVGISTAEELRKGSATQKAMGTLSYSEIEAVQQIFKALNGNGEGLLIASRIADNSSITRSVIVNALRKLESAGIVESRSLGMKGTYGKVLNDQFNEALKR